MKKPLLLGMLLVSVVSIAYLSLPRASRSRKTESIAELGKEVGVTFPAGARLLGVRRESGMDDYVAFKVEVNAQDVAKVLAQAQIEPDSLTSDNIAFFGLDQDFWDPNQARGFRAAQVSRLSTFRTLNVGIAEVRSDPSATPG